MLVRTLPWFLPLMIALVVPQLVGAQAPLGLSDKAPSESVATNLNSTEPPLSTSEIAPQIVQAEEEIGSLREQLTKLEDLPRAEEPPQ